MAKTSGKSGVAASLLWNLFERVGTQGIQLLVSIVLARLLLPADYGVLSLVTVFISIATVIVETGFGTALIQKKELEKNDINAIFTVNMLVSVLLYAVIFFAAPFIADFYANYDHDLLVQVLRIYALILPIGATTSVQSSMIYREMQFKKFFFINLSAIFLSGLTGVVLAVCGAGVWALIAQQITNKVVLFVTLTFTVKWKPRFTKAFTKCGKMFRFGANVLGNRLLNTVYLQLRSLLIGKFYTSEMLAFYNKGETFPSMIATNTDYAMQRVMLSAYSKEQDDLGRIKQMMRKTISASTYLLSPLMFGMAACAANLVDVLLTAKWNESVPFMQLFCLYYFLQPLKTTCSQALNGIGRSDITLKTGAASKILGIVSVIVTIWFGTIWIAIGALVTDVISVIIFMVANRVMFRYSFREQLRDVLPNMATAAVMVVAVFGVGTLLQGVGSLPALIVQVLVGAVVYIALSIVTKNQNFTYLKTTLLGRFFKK